MKMLLAFVVFILFSSSKSQTTTDCGVSYTCFTSPTGCVNSACIFIFKWRNNGNISLTDFFIAGNIGGSNSSNWLAIGFSTDQSMGNDDVVLCSVPDFSVQHYVNAKYVTPSLMNSANPTVGLSNPVVNNNNGWLTCSFTRLISMQSQQGYFDLSKPYFILAAYGAMLSSVPQNHYVNRVFSPSSFTFQFTPATAAATTPLSSLPANVSSNPSTPQSKTSQPTTIASVTAPIDTSDCLVSKGCYMSPSNCSPTSSCKFIFKYTADTNTTYFNLYGNVGSASNQWLAIGFSLDQLMGNDNVVLCTSSAVDHRMNQARLAPLLLDSNNPSIGLNNTIITLSNGWLSCSFTRNISNSSNPSYFDLSKQYYIFAAFGTYTTSRIVGFTGTLNYHSVNRDFSSSLVNFSSFSTTGGGSDTLFILKQKSHACLMIIAWMIFAPIGIVIARYFKSMLPNMKLCNVKFWFVIHRPLMMFVPIISITSFVIILWEVEWEWIKISDLSGFVHSIFGIVAIGLSIVQPLIALCRCDPDDKNRYCFNFFHRLFGFSALISSTVALFLGIYISDIDLGYYGWSFLGAWTIWMIIFLLSMEMIEMRFANSKASYSLKKDDFDGVVYENQDAAKAKKPEYIKRSAEQIIKEVLLVLHVIVVLGLSIALIVFIGTY